MLLRALLLSVAGVVLTYNAAANVVVTVPAHANPWLAGMPDGSIAGVAQPPFTGNDVAPAQSPSQVNLPVAAGMEFSFSATGTISHAGSGQPFYGPEGGPDNDGTFIVSRYLADENGIADIRAPYDALIGVFLDNQVPSQFNAPPLLDFSTAASRDFLTLSPALRQPFFIGDGLTSATIAQQFIAPEGSTRLYLGTMDTFGWAGNPGQFIVTVVPEPAGITLLAAIALLAMSRRATRCLQPRVYQTAPPFAVNT